MRVSDAILAGVWVSMFSKDASASAPYSPAEHFAKIGGLSFNTSSNANTTSATASSAIPLLPQSTPSNDLSSSAILPPSSMTDTLSTSAASFIAPTTAGPYNSTDAVPTPCSSSSTAPAVRPPPILYSTNHTLWHNASHPAQPNTTQPLNLSSLPKARSFPYTIGTGTQNHTVSSDGANRTMLMATLTGSLYSMEPVTETAAATGNGRATDTDSPDEEQNVTAPNTVQRSLFWMAATLVLAAAWPC